MFRPLVRGPPAACPCPPVLTHCHPHPHPHPHSCRHAPSLEALDLHLLGAAPMGAADATLVGMPPEITLLELVQA